jgi:hypothetical protein
VRAVVRGIDAFFLDAAPTQYASAQNGAGRP